MGEVEGLFVVDVEVEVGLVVFGADGVLFVVDVVAAAGVVGPASVSGCDLL